MIGIIVIAIIIIIPKIILKNSPEDLISKIITYRKKLSEKPKSHFLHH